MLVAGEGRFRRGGEVARRAGHAPGGEGALRLLHETVARGEYATGILYIEPDKQDFIELLGIVDEPLAGLPESKTRPGKAALDEIMESFR